MSSKDCSEVFLFFSSLGNRKTEKKEESWQADKQTKSQRRVESSIRSLFSSSLLHGMAIFRGMKPLFVWNSQRPWDEVQLQAWNSDSQTSAATPQQLVLTTVMNSLWYLLLVKSFVDVLRQYILINRDWKLRCSATQEHEA